MNHPNAQLFKRNSGFVLLSVLAVVAMAAIVSWAMLSVASLRMKTDNTAVQMIDADYLAESGLSLALYYLHKPDKSPVGSITGTAGDQHYPGQQNLVLWEGAAFPVDIVVTNPTPGLLTIRSSVTLISESGRTVRRVAEGQAKLFGDENSSYAPQAAIVSLSPLVLASEHQITGDIKSSGLVSLSNDDGDDDQVDGNILTVAAEDLWPATQSVLQLANALQFGAQSTDSLKYTLNGETYTADRVTFPLLSGTLNTSNPTRNPANVWIADSSVTTNNLVLNGTLIVRGSASNVTLRGGSNVIKSSSTMAAMVVENNLRFATTTSAGAIVDVEGLVYVGGEVERITSNTKVAELKIKGALVLASNEGTALSAFDSGKLTVDYVQERAVAENFVSTTSSAGRKVRLIRWDLYTLE